jgi:hypothetical protein
LGVHRITGEGTSGIMLNGLLLDAPYVTYPVNLDSDGGLAVNLTLPESYVTFPGGSLEVKVIDDAGRTGFGVWPIMARKIIVSPVESGRGGSVTVTGTGFLAAGRSITQCTTVDVAYAGTVMKKVLPDSTGSFTTTFTVPLTAAIPSTNTVTATIYGCVTAPTATATHKVPVRTLTVTPQGSPAGTEITISGISFVGFTPITGLTIGEVSVLSSPPPIVSGDGTFSVKVVVPALTAGTQVVSLSSAGVESVYPFVVLVTLPTLTPTPTSAAIPTSTPPPSPTPVPTPTVTPTPLPTRTPTVTPTPLLAPTATPAPKLVDAIQPLQASLLRIWAFDDTLGRWEYYDPRFGSAGRNNLTALTGGKLYWINVSENLTVTLNGRQRVLTAGWNLIHW